jgi:predicted benzoate:H+ symporter BenE
VFTLLALVGPIMVLVGLVVLLASAPSHPGSRQIGIALVCGGLLVLLGWTFLDWFLDGLGNSLRDG